MEYSVHCQYISIYVLKYFLLIGITTDNYNIFFGLSTSQKYRNIYIYIYVQEKGVENTMEMDRHICVLLGFITSLKCPVGQSNQNICDMDVTNQ